ncbi:hypothetical protein [Xylanimonas sp. McL0601]|uniref:hypothetical protein n=1 Tax=Xylanimonas sp. McL0601 TaxID=3414739 RepID=UPI003CF7DF3E
MNAHDDRNLVARLRAATAEVPPSGLDLEAVLRGARTKARRARAVTGAAVVVALGIAGAGAAEVGPRLLAPPAVDDAAARAAATCPDGRPLAVVFSGQVETETPVLVALARTTIPDPQGVDDSAPQGVVWEDVMLDSGLGDEAVHAPSAPAWYRAEILARAERANDPALVPTPPLPRPGGSATEGEEVTDPLPGATYLLYRAGTSVSTDGEAGCGSEREPFQLTYTTVSESGLLRCGIPMTGFETAAARNALSGYCPSDEGATAARQP